MDSIANINKNIYLNLPNFESSNQAKIKNENNEFKICPSILFNPIALCMPI